MTQKHHEAMSSLMDGESISDEVINRIKDDDQLSASWERYHLYRDVMRKETAPEIHLDIAANVAQALEQEPVVLAPVKKKQHDIPVIGNVIPWFKQAGQFAIAASVTAAVILGVQTMNQPETVNQDVMSAPVIKLDGINSGISPVSLESTKTLSTEQMIDQRKRLKAFMLDHHQQKRLQMIREADKKKDPQESDDEQN